MIDKALIDNAVVNSNRLHRSEILARLQTALINQFILLRRSKDPLADKVADNLFDLTRMRAALIKAPRRRRRFALGFTR